MITLKDIRDELRNQQLLHEARPLNEQQVRAVFTKLINDLGELEAQETEADSEKVAVKYIGDVLEWPNEPIKVIAAMATDLVETGNWAYVD